MSGSDRIMLRREPLLLCVFLLCSTLALGCARCDDGPVELSTEEPAPEPGTEEVAAPTVEQLPLPQDFAEHAARRVTEENYREELERVAREIGPLPERAEDDRSSRGDGESRRRRSSP